MASIVHHASAASCVTLCGERNDVSSSDSATDVDCRVCRLVLGRQQVAPGAAAAAAYVLKRRRRCVVALKYATGTRRARLVERIGVMDDALEKFVGGPR